MILFETLANHIHDSSGGATGGIGGIRPPPPILKSRQKLSKKNGIKLVGYTFRLKDYVKIPPFLSDFSELAPPLHDSVPSFCQNDDGLCIDWQKEVIFRVDILQSIWK